jgi:hypothetical protein
MYQKHIQYVKYYKESIHVSSSTSTCFSECRSYSGRRQYKTIYKSIKLKLINHIHTQRSNSSYRYLPEVVENSPKHVAELICTDDL